MRLHAVSEAQGCPLPQWEFMRLFSSFRVIAMGMIVPRRTIYFTCVLFQRLFGLFIADAQLAVSAPIEVVLVMVCIFQDTCSLEAVTMSYTLICWGQ